MPDEKISQLSEATAIIDADLFPVVQNTSTTPVTRAKTGTIVKTWLKTYFDTLYLTVSNTVTVTNKRVQKRVVAVTQHATPTWNTDNGDIFEIVALAQAITSMTTNLSGTPVEGEMIMVIFKDNATARAITWGSEFASSGNAILPVTTVLSVPMAVLLQRRTSAIWTAASVWVCIGIA